MLLLQYSVNVSCDLQVLYAFFNAGRWRASCGKGGKDPNAD